MMMPAQGRDQGPAQEPITRAQLEELDRGDPLAHFRPRFHIPKNLLYFDGNSLGPLPLAVRERLEKVIDGEWGEGLIGSWNEHAWIDLPKRIGAKIAPLVGAEADEVVVCDSVSVNLFKLLATAVRLRPERRILLCQEDHFPTDLYIAQGLAELADGRLEVRTVGVDGLADAVDEEVAVMCVGHVDFRTGRCFDMKGITAACHRAGALALWDLSHSAGALPVKLDRCEVDLAVGCGYKFLCGGPGAPSFLYVARRHQEAARSPLPGWLGHRRPFDFSPDYEPAPGVGRFVCGTPPILAMSALDAALDLWQEVDLEALRAKSMALGDIFLQLVGQECAGLGPGGSDLRLATPENAHERGSQVGFHHPDGYEIMQALIARRLVGDFRAPDILRFGLCPLFLRHVDIWDCVAGIRQVLESREYLDESFRRRGIVT